ncbi:MAG TPA: hypothetical protein VLV28_08685 [Gaiellaceae bacterium]|nr:hypothetical protein [Gaiellaceae bacterium]
MVAAKSLLAAALIGLLWASAALADAPTVRISSADQAIAKAALLRRSDFGAGWLGGPIKTSPLSSPNCPGFDPKESDLVVSGHADARYRFQQGGVELDQDVQVLESQASVLTDFARTISPQLANCLAYQLGKLPNVVRASVTRVPFPPTGAVSAVYRAEIAVKTARGQGSLLSDYVFFGEGRVEYEFTVIAPVGARDQLAQFEVGLAQILLRRAGATPA